MPFPQLDQRPCDFFYNLTFLNALFEAVSGFTSTGFTIFENIKHMKMTTGKLETIKP